MPSDTDTPEIISRQEARARGLWRYFTGKPCKYGHIAQRRVSNKECYGCILVYRASKGWFNQLDPAKQGRAKYKISPKGRAAQKRYDHKRRLKVLAEANFTAEDHIKLLAQTHCHICKKPFSSKDPAELDHVIALAYGGRHEASNIALAHRSCNRSKGSKRMFLI
jgi:5-methylcytosine-specific restriction endonuclease McrA